MPYRVRRATQELRASVCSAAPVAGGRQPLPQAGIQKNSRWAKRAPRLIGALFVFVWVKLDDRPSVPLAVIV